ncbi:hypothetical protein RZN37_27820, partial [Klebsiella pneumoniae]|nr:hypothetical protein [Klebsiella pneumoniae]
RIPLLVGLVVTLLPFARNLETTASAFAWLAANATCTIHFLSPFSSNSRAFSASAFFSASALRFASAAFLSASA